MTYHIYSADLCLPDALLCIRQILEIIHPFKYEYVRQLLEDISLKSVCKLCLEIKFVLKRKQNRGHEIKVVPTKLKLRGLLGFKNVDHVTSKFKVKI